MKTNPLLQVEACGQSIWLDFIQRDLILGGELRRMIAEDGLRGMTSNPALFEKAINSSQAYEAAIRALASEGHTAMETYEALALHDVQMAADEFREVYDRTDGREGYVSLEVSPHLARDAQGTLQEARRLWFRLNRPNVLIKVPATAECLPTIRQLISEGLNINVTLLFSLPRYREVAEAYLAGLEDRRARGLSLKRVTSVASFFVSRMDVLVDGLLKPMIERQDQVGELARYVSGQTGIACARLAYQSYHSLFGTLRFKQLVASGARVQRLLWASTGTKNPTESDVKYVEALIGPATINTLPLETLVAYREHGQPQSRLETEVARAALVLARLQELGINLDEVCRQLETEGIEKFVQPFDRLLDTLSNRMARAA